MSFYRDTTNYSNYPFGQLPITYGSGNSSVASAPNLFGDGITCWDINDKSGLVQSLPETQSVMRGMGASPSVFGGGYFNNLVAQQSAFPIGNSGGMGGMEEILGLSMQLMAINAQAKARKAQQAKLEEQQQEKEETETITRKTKFDSTQLDTFITNENQNSELVYGKFEKFTEDRYKELKEATENKVVTLDAALESLGIKSIPSKSEAKLIEELKKADSTHDIKTKGLSQKQFGALLNKIGINEDSDTISRQSYEDGIGKLRGGDIKPEDAKKKEEVAATKEELLEDDLHELKNLVDKTSWNQELSGRDIEKIKEIIKKAADCGDKDTLKEFLGKLQSAKVKGENGTTTVLGSILTGMLESNDTGNDKEVLNEFETSILEPLKKAAKEHGLNTEWNNTLDKLNGDELTHIKDKVNGLTGSTLLKPFTWQEKMSGFFTEWASTDVGKTLSILKTAHLPTKSHKSKPAEETTPTTTAAATPEPPKAEEPKPEEPQH